MAEPITPGDRTWLATAVAALHGEIHDLSAVAEQFRYLFRAPLPEESITLLGDPEGALVPLETLAAAIASLPEVTTETAAAALRRVRNTSSLAGRPFFLPIRAALTGRDRGPELETILMLLGGDETCRRLYACAAALRGP